MTKNLGAFLIVNALYGLLYGYVKNFLNTPEQSLTRGLLGSHYVSDLVDLTMRSLLRLITQIFLALGPLLYVLGICFVLGAFVGIAALTGAFLSSRGVPILLTFLLSVVVIPVLILVPLALLANIVDGKLGISRWVKDWIYECTH